jgi:hypothetical protein
MWSPETQTLKNMIQFNGAIVLSFWKVNMKNTLRRKTHSPFITLKNIDPSPETITVHRKTIHLPINRYGIATITIPKIIF